MKWGRFFLGLAAGMAVSYVYTKKKSPSLIKPEKVIQMVKERYKETMSITGSWIHTEPKKEAINGIQYTIYQGGFTAVIDGYPTFYEFKVDADTGTLLQLEP
ncbi:PepSY domain-containing protein [Caldalkalibacillus mannanilyticus]|uniref:PepSY domain-containing protein n=1 Tax=Caldalkalibacillus mannanilyticus TaxID=1418 RepID=UPI00046A8B86|nr:PepSY domain-containing protein [Caldalkalibacillus mannanilyticus]